MRENRHFVRSTDVSKWQPALVGGAPSATSYHQLIERIEKLAGRDAAALFAEPVLPSGVAGAGTAVSWYCSRDGNVTELDAIDEVARRRIVRKLTARLAALAPALRDAAIGPAAGTWLNVADPADIVSVGGEPVLVNWGFLPADVRADPAARRDHFARTLGRFAPDLPVPPVEAALPTETPDSSLRNEENRSSVMPTPPPPTSDQAARAGRDTPTAAPPPVPPAAPRMPPHMPWRAPLVACALAALALIILLLPGVLRFPDRDSAAREAQDLQRLRSSNESLETQLAALQDAARDRVCKAGDPIIQVPDKSKPDAPPAKMELLPRPPDQVPLPSQANEADKTTVAGLLEGATVLVYSVKGKNSWQGTGFFVNDRDIVTNRHVIAQADAETIFVASRALGGIRHARLVARSDENPENSDIGVDLAVLELEPGASHTFLPVGPTPAKLSTVYVAGFPGFITEEDVNFDNFLRKLSESLGKSDVDEALRQSHAAVPSPDLRYGRVNNVIHSGAQELPLILHDMQLAPGHSGGPLVDACGRVGGINTWVRQNNKGPQQANLAQDVSIIGQFLKEHNISFTSDQSACASSPSLAQSLQKPPAAK